MPYHCMDLLAEHGFRHQTLQVPVCLASSVSRFADSFSRKSTFNQCLRRRVLLVCISFVLLTSEGAEHSTWVPLVPVQQIGVTTSCHGASWRARQLLSNVTLYSPGRVIPAVFSLSLSLCCQCRLTSHGDLPVVLVFRSASICTSISVDARVLIF